MICTIFDIFIDGEQGSGLKRDNGGEVLSLHPTIHLSLHFPRKKAGLGYAWGLRGPWRLSVGPQRLKVRPRDGTWSP